MHRLHAYVGLDVHKETIAVAIAEHRRTGEARFWGNIPNTLTDLQGLIRKLTERYKCGVVPGSVRPASFGSGQRTKRVPALSQVLRSVDSALLTSLQQLSVGELRLLRKTR